MKLEILTPDKKIFDDVVNSVTVPGKQGSFEILKNHAPIISTLDDGKVIIRTSQSETSLNISGGVVEVINDSIIILAESIISE